MRLHHLALFCLAATALTLAGCNCSTPPARAKLRDLGVPCSFDDECELGLCDAVGAGDKVCLKPCAEGCDTTEICTGLGDSRYTCVADRAGLCQTCTTSADCSYPADECLQLGTEAFCGRDCSFDGVCPQSFQCADGVTITGADITKQCQPISGTCGCIQESDGQAVPCENTNTFGTCMGTQTCQAGVGYTTCTARVAAPESCNGLDDDCNGQMDENLGDETCGVGACQRSVSRCVNGEVQTCVPADAGSPEICNEVDDDCDGETDEEFDLDGGVDNCGGCGNICNLPNATPACVSGTCAVSACADNYGNCNNQPEDGCEVDLTNTVNHCGACGTVCAFPNAVPACTNSACTFTCEPNFWDVDNDPANGCEYACTRTSDTDFPDLAFVDANCDGIDGEIGNSVFVSQTGNDANDGSRLSPRRTINAGISKAILDGKRDVLVSGGTFAGTTNITAGKSVYGSYNPLDWSRNNAFASNLGPANPVVSIDGSDNSRLQLLTLTGSNATGSSGTAYGARVINSNNLTFEGLTINAGSGSNGTNGSSGFTGADGQVGKPGTPGCEESGGFCASCPQPQGGLGGTSSCGTPGGRGGNARRSSDPGDKGSDGEGGLAGTADDTPGGPGCPTRQGNWNTPTIYWGEDGLVGNTGPQGTMGSAAGIVSMVGYVISPTSNGGVGRPGRGGGGGGGGGGGETDCDSYGSSGGGGGGGACGGTGGTRGTSGGASIGVFMYASSITANTVAITTGNGGNGGNGGGGGFGGNGGAGGARGGYGGGGEQDDGSNGAPGGKGGNGGRGGHGGAGGGGPSLGVMRGAGSSWMGTGVMVTLGTGGLGGTSPLGTAPNGTMSSLY